MGFFDCFANSKSLVIILCILAVVLIIQGLASTEWVFANDGYRQGLFVYCPGNGTKLPVVDLPASLGDSGSDSNSPESADSPESSDEGSKSDEKKSPDKKSDSSSSESDEKKKPGKNKADKSSSSESDSDEKKKSGKKSDKSSSSESDSDEKKKSGGKGKAADKSSSSESDSDEKKKVGKKDSDSKSGSSSSESDSDESGSDSSEEEEEEYCFRIDLNYQFYTLVAAWFYIGTLITTIVGMFYTAMGLKSTEILMEKPRLYRIAVWSLSIGTALAIATVVLYASCFEGLRKHKEAWEMGWSYICGWVVALSLYTSVLLLICGPEPDPNETFPGEKLDEEKGGEEEGEGKAAANHSKA